MTVVYRDRLVDVTQATSFAVIGDTQRTMTYQLLMGREWNNHPERSRLVDDIARRSPACLVVAGDLVSYGQLDRDWRYFDDVMEPLRARGVPLLPVVGNHDYFISRSRSLPRLRARFPRLADVTWYEERLGPLALVVIDSNRGPLGAETWARQRAWLSARAKELDADPSVRGVFFFGHHPPITNSFEVGPHGPTLADVVPTFAGMRKSLAYVSGHCHAYERFERHGKTFLVSGGGGGPRQPLRRGRLARSPDLYPGGTMRPFHYLWMTVEADGVTVEVRGMERRETELRELERFTLAFAR
jgi:hypothetical protein